MTKETRKELETVKETLYSISATLYDLWTSEELRTAKLARITVGKELDLVNSAIATVAQAIDLKESRVYRNWDLTL
jgi:hypothetical protein